MADDKKEIDEFSGVETTGHEWDGIKELNNPLPRWWLWTWYASIAFSIGYVIYYPAIPLVNSVTQGISGTTSRQIFEAELKAAKAAKAGIRAKIQATSLNDIRKTDELFRFSVAGGKSMYKVHCSQCHGSGAQGAPGYPNLNDDDWLWGGSLDAIYTSIKHGIRNDDYDDARTSEMPKFGVDEIIEPAVIKDIANHVLAISGQEHDAKLASAGAPAYAESCAACHGDKGKGDPELGAPNLTDAISFYGNTETKLIAQIADPKHGVMPGWGRRLGEVSVKQLTIYIHSLGGGQ